RFELDLPRAAITTFDIDVPAAVKEVRIQADARNGARNVTPRPTECQRGRADAGALGPIKHLEVSWPAPLVLPSGPPLLAADARVTVRVDEAAVVQDAELR